MGGGTVKTPEQIAAGLTEAQKRNLKALGTGWQTASEMRHNGATGSGLTSLTCTGFEQQKQLCDRQWASWQGGEGYEYRVTPLGQQVRAILEPKP